MLQLHVTMKSRESLQLLMGAAQALRAHTSLSSYLPTPSTCMHAVSFAADRHALGADPVSLGCRVQSGSRWHSQRMCRVARFVEGYVGGGGAANKIPTLWRIFGVNLWGRVCQAEATEQKLELEWNGSSSPVASLNCYIPCCA